MKSIIIALYLISAVCWAYGQDRPYNFYTIEDLNRRGVTFGVYEVEGYVTQKVVCPPCPEPGVCAPCPPDYIVISQNNSLLAKYEVTDKELIIFTKNAERFEIGKKYRFLIRVLDVKSTEQKLNNIQLIHSERL